MKKSGFISSILKNKCPRCRKGKLFKNDNPYDLNKVLDMQDNCPVCGQRTELEIGFWYGTGYVSYVLAVMFSVLNLTWYWLIFGITWRDNSIFHWLIVNGIILTLSMPVLMRLSRTLYLTFYIGYDPEAAEDRH
ncbi:uncharacterized protein DUF983 [Chitinophaga polysaccharea]|uniref:Uncharacterized protein DUF983 n=1 Tax=Chitinophaga polysaccharea TaxID=1293035 RepID=A0A561PVX7_9BACT|nr:DUF983 domain-containing protein [Chitinophaga polysaccharea]TWF42261.1 uncharacterized protein DUF983 [Chitinophaga polysaccharea]